MALVLAMVVEGLVSFASTLWSLQERRFSTTFETVSSVAVSVTTALVLCFLSVQSHRRSEIALAFI